MDGSSKDDGLTEITVRVARSRVKAIKAMAAEDAAWVEMVRRGMEDAEAGRVVSNDEAQEIFKATIAEAAARPKKA